MRLIDTHAHLDDEKFRDDLEHVLARASDAGVEYIISCGSDLDSSRRAARIASEHAPVFASVGVHPHDARHYDAGMRSELRELSREHKVLAIGEIGLDFHYNFSPRKDQMAAFEDQIGLALELNLPVVVHSRDAGDLALEVIRSAAPNICGCVFHCFSGDVSFARRVLDMGFYIGVDGPITFKNAGRLADVVRMCPLERLLLETDCPYLAPVPHRGKRNEPAYLTYIAQAAAQTKAVDVELLADAAAENARRLFGRALQELG